jgi:hypothetical protein
VTNWFLVYLDIIEDDRFIEPNRFVIVTIIVVGQCLVEAELIVGVNWLTIIVGLIEQTKVIGLLTVIGNW